MTVETGFDFGELLFDLESSQSGIAGLRGAGGAAFDELFEALVIVLQLLEARLQLLALCGTLRIGDPSDGLALFDPVAGADRQVFDAAATGGFDDPLIDRFDDPGPASTLVGGFRLDGGDLDGRHLRGVIRRAGRLGVRVVGAPRRQDGDQEQRCRPQMASGGGATREWWNHRYSTGR